MNRKKRWLSLLLMLTLLFSLACIPAQAVDQSAAPLSSAAFLGKVNQLGASEEGLTLVVQTQGNTPLKNDFGATSKAEGFNGWHILRYTSAAAADEALAQLRYCPRKIKRQLLTTARCKQERPRP